MNAKSPPDEQDMHPEDKAILQSIRRGNDWLRAVLCTIARRGVVFRNTQPTRSKQILDILSTLPLYKAGQFLFDLMEWEDFMVNGPPPAPVPTTLDAKTFEKISTFLLSIKSHLDSSVDTDVLKDLEVNIASISLEDEELPPMEPGFYLYQDVIIGLIRSTAPLLIGTDFEAKL